MICTVRHGVVATADSPGIFPFVGIEGCRICGVVCRDALRTHHTAGLSAAIDLVDLGTIVQVDLGVFVPCVRAVASTVDGARSHAILVVALAHGHVDVDDAVEGAACSIVAAVDGTQHHVVAYLVLVLVLTCTVVHQQGIGTVILHMPFVDVARLKDVAAIAAGKEAAHLDGGACRDVHP